MPKINFEEAELMAIYIDRLIVDKGLAAANREQNGDLARQLRQQFDEACQKAMIDALPDAKLDELSKLLEAGATDDQIENFFNGAGVDFPKVIQDTMIKFRADYLGTVKKTAEVATAEAAVASKPAENAVVEMAAAAEAPTTMTNLANTTQLGADAINQSPAANVAPSPATNATQPPVDNINKPLADNTVQPPVGNSIQGTTSVAPGASDVEGVEQITTITTEENM